MLSSQHYYLHSSKWEKRDTELKMFSQSPKASKCLARIQTLAVSLRLPSLWKLQKWKCNTWRRPKLCINSSYEQWNSFLHENQLYDCIPHYMFILCTLCPLQKKLSLLNWKSPKRRYLYGSSSVYVAGVMLCQHSSHWPFAQMDQNLLIKSEAETATYFLEREKVLFPKL